MPSFVLLNQNTTHPNGLLSKTFKPKINIPIIFMEKTEIVDHTWQTDGSNCPRNG